MINIELMKTRNKNNDQMKGEKTGQKSNKMVYNINEGRNRRNKKMKKLLIVAVMTLAIVFACTSVSYAIDIRKINNDVDVEGSLSFDAGQQVDTIITDGTFSANLDTNLPTEQAVKEYVDSVDQNDDLSDDDLDALQNVDAMTEADDDILFYDVDGWNRLAHGTDGQVLTYTTANGMEYTDKTVDTNTQLSQEEVDDYVDALINDGDSVHTFIDITYDDTDDAMDFVVPVLDEDDLDTNSDVHLATQQSIKAYVDGEISGITTNSYRTSFVNADLTAGVLTVNHALSEKFVTVQVFDNSDNLVLPDETTLTDANNSSVDLSSWGTITGTWNVVVTK